MGSKTIQGHLWGQRPDDWADVQEKTGNSGYLYVLGRHEIKAADNLLDVGCGSGLFAGMAHLNGINVTGIDASDQMIAKARQRTPAITFLTGEMEELPFSDDSFDVVCGFNSYQYAADVKNAFTESKRVLKTGGKIIVMIWGDKENCEAASYLKAVGSLLPLPPPGSAGPFALSENRLLETMLTDSGFHITHQADISAIWDYESKNIAMKGLLSAGPAAKAIDHSGFDKVHTTLANAIAPYIQPDGHVIYQNEFRIVIAEK